MGQIRERTSACAVLTGLEAFALVDLDLAVDALIAGLTETSVLSDAVLTLSVETGIAGALVDVNLTVGA